MWDDCVNFSGFPYGYIINESVLYMWGEGNLCSPFYDPAVFICSHAMP